PGPDGLLRDALEDPAAERAIELEIVEVHVADVAAAGHVGAWPFTKACVEGPVVEIADDLVDEVASTYVALAIHRDHACARSARTTQTRMRLKVDPKEWVDAFEIRDVVRCVCLRTFGGVDP